jgi:hypothetical protein
MHGADPLAELEWEGRPERPSLRRAIRHRLRRFDPSIRVIAEDFMAETSRVDLLAVGGEGEIISIRIGRGGDDRTLFTQALADLSWLRPRLPDFLKLAPGLGLEPSAAPRAILMCPEFSRETLAAVETCAPRSMELATYHCLRQQGRLSVLLETRSVSQQSSIARPTTITDHDRTGSRTETLSATRPRSPEQTTESSRRTSFRTGLSDADLRIEVEEEKILD